MCCGLVNCCCSILTCALFTSSTIANVVSTPISHIYVFVFGCSKDNERKKIAPSSHPDEVDIIHELQSSLNKRLATISPALHQPKRNMPNEVIEQIDRTLENNFIDKFRPFLVGLRKKFTLNLTMIL